jgi:hypothetical protein
MFSPCQDDILPPLLLHLAVLRALGLDKVLAVGSHRLQPNQGCHEVLCHPVIGSLCGASASAIQTQVVSSVADPGCLSRIPDPDFYPSRIPNPKTATEERGEKKIVVITFYVATNFTKLQIILVLKC